MKNVLSLMLAALLAAAAPLNGALEAAPLTDHVTVNTVTVTVTYKGKGTVDASHKLWVWLFDSPNIGAGSMPIGQVAIDKNGADAVFDNVAGDKVYVAVAFDEQGAMTGDAPPPSGTPIGVLIGADGAPSGVAPGGKSAVRLTFDDSQRMP
jgi:hypothetical protein